QVTSALAFVYLISGIHVDLTCGNLCLDDSLRIKLLDFSGSLLDNLEPRVVVTASHRCPRNNFKLI
ncbi:hypothetical protein BCR34DRAFT_499676, partial [Clohesyomyces aquaticus]